MIPVRFQKDAEGDKSRMSLLHVVARRYVVRLDLVRWVFGFYKLSIPQFDAFKLALEKFAQLRT